MSSSSCPRKESLQVRCFDQAVLVYRSISCSFQSPRGLLCELAVPLTISPSPNLFPPKRTLPSHLTVDWCAREPLALFRGVKYLFGHARLGTNQLVQDESCTQSAEPVNLHTKIPLVHSCYTRPLRVCGGDGQQLKLVEYRRWYFVCRICY